MISRVVMAGEDNCHAGSSGNTHAHTHALTHLPVAQRIQSDLPSILRKSGRETSHDQSCVWKGWCGHGAEVLCMFTPPGPPLASG